MKSALEKRVLELQEEVRQWKKQAAFECEQKNKFILERNEARDFSAKMYLAGKKALELIAQTETIRRREAQATGLVDVLEEYKRVQKIPQKTFSRKEIET